MKKTSLYAILILLWHSSFSQTLWNDQVNVVTTGTSMANAVMYTPANYTPTKKYPLVIFSHGTGEAGTDINKLYNTGLPYVLKSGYKPAFDFIMIAPQRSSYSFPPDWLPGILKDAIARFPVDTTRIYLTGLSAGGWDCFGSQLNVDSMLGQKVAAIVACSGATQDANMNNMSWWGSSKTPLWAVVGDQDSFYPYNVNMVNSINAKAPVASLTVRAGVGHGGWNDVYFGNVKNAAGQNMWNWLAGFQRLPASTQPDPLPIKAHSLSVIHNQDGSFTASFIASATVNTKNFVLMYSGDGIHFSPVHVVIPDMLAEKTYSFNFKLPQP
jgi:predicted peptidase